MEIVGFADVSETAACMGAMDPSQFRNKTCAVMEFSRDGGALVLCPDGSALAMIEPDEIKRRFECTYMNSVVCPPDLAPIAQTMYCMKVLGRRGGYAPVLRGMVIQASLMRGEFDDRMLWHNQD